MEIKRRSPPSLAGNGTGGITINSKRKGCAGEREFAALCREHGIEDAHRGQQFKGGFDSPDVAGLPGYHVEVKRVERLNITEAMNQSIRDSEGKAVPIVAHRRNRSPWLITLLADDFLNLITKGKSAHSETVNAPPAP